MNPYALRLWRHTITAAEGGLETFEDEAAVGAMLTGCRQWLQEDRRIVGRLGPDGQAQWLSTFAKDRAWVTQLEIDLEAWLLARRDGGDRPLPPARPGISEVGGR